MNAAVAYTETVSVPKKVNFTVAKRSPSGFSKDGGRTRIDVPKYKNILNQDRCVLSENIVNAFNEAWGSTYLTIKNENEVYAPQNIFIGTLGTVAHKRFIRGENVIWKAEQEKLGKAPRLNANDQIVFEWGDFNVDVKNKPSDKGLLVFLLTHNQNEDNKYRDDAIGKASFKVQDNRRNAASELNSRRDKVKQATDIVYELRDTKTKRFDKDKMEFYSNVFRQQISGFDSDEEKFIALLNIADNTPDVIIDGVNNESVNYLQVIQQAIALNILVRDKTRYINTQTENKVVTFKVGTPEGEAIKKMVDYYSSQDGEAEFKHLKNSVESIKQSRIN